MPYTPICIAKAVKNSTESEGMRRAHVSRAAGPGNRMGGGQKGPAPSSSVWPRTWHRFRISLDLCPSGLPESVGEWNKLLCWACRPVVLATCEEDYEFDASIRCTVDSVSKNKNNKIGCIKFLGSVIYNAKEGG